MVKRRIRRSTSLRCKDDSDCVQGKGKGVCMIKSMALGGAVGSNPSYRCVCMNRAGGLRLCIEVNRLILRSKNYKLGICAADLPNSLRKKRSLITTTRTKYRLKIRRCYNVAPSQSVAVLVRNEQGEKELVGLTWGLIPHWAKDPAKLKPQINARSETVGEKPFFRDAFKRSRCVVPASGYYEWAKKESGKQPYYIHGKDSSLLSLAGVWATCVMPESRLQTILLFLLKTLHPR